LRKVGIVLVCAVVAAVALVAVRAHKSDRHAAPPATTATTATTATSTQATEQRDTGIKPTIRGLVEQFDDRTAELTNTLHSFVVSAYWSDLQPEAGGPIAHPNAIDDAIAAVRTGSERKPSRLKVRIFAGIYAPEWAKTLGGAPFTIQDPASGRGGTVGRFWTSEFGDAYAALQRELAATYDDVPEIAEVTVSRCTTVFAEPFLRQITYSGAPDAYLDAGYTRAADERCQREEIDAHDVWKRTRSGLALNPYQFVGPERRGYVDGDVTTAMMRYCRDTLGPRCVLENNSIRWPPQGQRYTAMYTAMKDFGPPISFQTAAAARIGDPVETVRWAIRFGAGAVELGARANAYSHAQLVDLDAALTAGN
jgi:hypothetical protein